ncbi:hypothetical protein TNCT_442701 [Trichonephila clavata]|uniref:Uncharacterized protein n=1 Tax=Trichonephila clavata TaxID=2740835 RepID=A0A8X6LAT3_TRICU|nr:hypothetical protein TNCT_442701 [Trichonephila clavata]
MGYQKQQAVHLSYVRRSVGSLTCRLVRLPGIAMSHQSPYQLESNDFPSIEKRRLKIGLQSHSLNLKLKHPSPVMILGAF